jgi:hypothetical protein
MLAEQSGYAFRIVYQSSSQAGHFIGTGWKPRAISGACCPGDRRRTIRAERGTGRSKVVTYLGMLVPRGRTALTSSHAFKYRLVIMVVMPFVVAGYWYVIAAATTPIGGVKLGPFIPGRQAEAVAVSTMAKSHGTSRTWVVTHSAFHPISSIVSDSAGSRRFGSSAVACPSEFVGRGLRRLGTECPPAPVWAVQVETPSRTEGYKALVEVDALSGKTLAWQIDDALP